jgi:hypothetical protein
MANRSETVMCELVARVDALKAKRPSTLRSPERRRSGPAEDGARRREHRKASSGARREHQAGKHCARHVRVLRVRRPQLHAERR